MGGHTRSTCSRRPDMPAHRFKGVGAIAEAIKAMHSGEVLRAVVTY